MWESETRGEVIDTIPSPYYFEPPKQSSSSSLFFLPSSFLPISSLSSKGLSFFSIAVPPRQLATIPHKEFESLQMLMADCLNHMWLAKPKPPTVVAKMKTFPQHLQVGVHTLCVY